MAAICLGLNVLKHMPNMTISLTSPAMSFDLPQVFRISSLCGRFWHAEWTVINTKSLSARTFLQSLIKLLVCECVNTGTALFVQLWWLIIWNISTRVMSLPVDDSSLIPARRDWSKIITKFVITIIYSRPPSESWDFATAQSPRPFWNRIKNIYQHIQQILHRRHIHCNPHRSSWTTMINAYRSTAHK